MFVTGLVLAAGGSRRLGGPKQEFTAGCGSSIRTALEAVDERSDGLVLMLGDQPGITPESVQQLIALGPDAPIAVCRSSDDVGHPFWFRRELFDELRALHGDKGVWKLIESTRWPVAEAPRDGAVPLDVDTWEDCEALLLTSAVVEGARS